MNLRLGTPTNWSTFSSLKVELWSSVSIRYLIFLVVCVDYNSANFIPSIYWCDCFRFSVCSHKLHRGAITLERLVSKYTIFSELIHALCKNLNPPQSIGVPKKFSTTRKHKVWIHQFLKPIQVDFQTVKSAQYMIYSYIYN